jgi:hypothetical protein
MPMYFFHIRRGNKLETDEVGLELEDKEAARAEARRSAGEMLRDGTLRPADMLEVLDGEGGVILRFCCSDVEEI